MGWNPFKSKEVTTVSTSVSRLVEDNAVPNSVKSGQIKAIFNEAGISENVMEELVRGIGTKAERMYRYAEKHYAWGMPSGEQYSNTQGRTEVEQAIEAFEGQQVSIEYSYFGSANVLHFAWLRLQAEHGYNADTNLLNNLTAQKGTPVYLKDIVVVVPANQTINDNSMLQQWGTPPSAGYTPQRPAMNEDVATVVTHSPIAFSSTAQAIYVEVKYVWKTGQQIHESTFILEHPYDYRDGYFMAKYKAGNNTKFWSYLIKSGTNPVLDNVFVDGPAESGSYFPFTYFRFNKASTRTQTSSQAYITSKKMMKTLGIDYDALGDAIDENPDIADIEQAMMVFAVPPVSTNPQENRYLFDYFDSLRAAANANNESNTNKQILSLLNSTLGYGFGGSEHSIIIQDQRFKMALGFNNIYKRTRAGSIGNVGTYTSAYAMTTFDYTVRNQDTGQLETVSIPKETHTYRHQLSKNLYEEITVHDLQMTYFIYNGYNTVGDETDAILLIPIDRTISEDYSIKDREILYARAMHFVFNARVTQKVKWYQQSWFRTVLLVAAIVLTVMDMGTDGGSWIASALELSGTEAIVATVIFNLVVTSFVMPAVFRLFVKLVGTELATLIAVAAIVYGGYQIASNGIKGAPYAGDMLMLSTGLSKAVLEFKYTDLLDEAKTFELYAEEKTKELEEAQKLLETNTVLSPFVIFGEKPEEYFNRTVHYGNIGTLGITAISSYVDMALTLPKVQDTLGEPLNG